jgi:hypothetical protein
VGGLDRWKENRQDGFPTFMHFMYLEKGTPIFPDKVFLVLSWHKKFERGFRVLLYKNAFHEVERSMV